MLLPVVFVVSMIRMNSAQVREGGGGVLVRYQLNHLLYRRLCLLEAEELPYFLYIQNIERIGDFRLLLFLDSFLKIEVEWGVYVLLHNLYV